MGISSLVAERKDGVVLVRGYASCSGRVILTLYHDADTGLVVRDQVVYDQGGRFGERFQAGAGGDLFVGARCEEDTHEVFAPANRDDHRINASGWQGWIFVALGAGAFLTWYKKRGGRRTKRRRAAPATPTRETEE